MTLNFHSTDKLARNPAILAREVIDEVVLVNPDIPDLPLFLNSIAAQIWSMFDGQRSIYDISEALASEFDADQRDTHSDVLELVTQLNTIGAISRD